MKVRKNICKKVNWKLAVLLLLSLATMLYYGNQKEGYHVDEIYSYGLANSEYLPFMHFGEQEYSVKDWMLEYGAGESLWMLAGNLVKDFQILKECGFQPKESSIYQDYLIAQENSADTKTTSWVSGQAYMDYVAVSESNTFNYASVYYNQRGDVHPPLYYILLHTICSVFPGTFSKWFGLALNIAAMLLTLTFLYRMCRDHLGGETIALVVTGVYGLSAGFVSTALFLRMYALLTFMTVVCCHIHLKIAEEQFVLKGGNRWKLVLAVLGGFLTHYYFVLYAFGIAVVSCIWMLARKKWKEMIGYILTLAGTAVLGLCIWPFALKHVFRGYRGLESLNVVLNREFYFEKIQIMFEDAADWLLAGQGWVLILCFLALMLLFLWKKGRSLPLAKGALVVLPIVFYTVAVAQLAPFLTARYIMCTYPFWYLFIVGTAALVLRQGWERLKSPEEKPGKPGFGNQTGWKTVGMAAVGVLLFAVSCVFMRTPDHLRLGGQETVVIPENTDCVYVLEDGDWNQSAIDSTILAQCRSVGVAYRSDTGRLAESYEYQDGDYLMIAIQSEMDIDAVLLQMKSLFAVEDLVEVRREWGDTSVRVLLHR